MKRRETVHLFVAALAGTLVGFGLALVVSAVLRRTWTFPWLVPFLLLGGLAALAVQFAFQLAFAVRIAEAAAPEPHRLLVSKEEVRTPDGPAGPAEEPEPPPEPAPVPRDPPEPEHTWIPAAGGNFSTTRSGTNRRIDAIVIHTAEGGYDPRESFQDNRHVSYTGAINTFGNSASEVSAHYVIGPAGELVKMVEENDEAFHATYYNKRSIGIEVSGFLSREETWNDSVMETLVNLVAYLAVKHNVPVIHPEGDARTSGGWYDQPGILGHDQIQTPGSAATSKYSSRSDPGPHFPWAEFIGRVQRRIVSFQQPAASRQRPREIQVERSIVEILSGLRD